MFTSALNKSNLWEFYAIGYSSQMEYNVPFEDVWRPRPHIKIEAHSPLTMFIKLPDGKEIGSKYKIEITDDLRRSFVFNDLPKTIENQFSPFDGGIYMPEGLPIVQFSPPFIEETVQQIILPEQYIPYMHDLPIQLFGNGFGEYTLKLSVVEGDITTTYKEINGMIDSGENIELKMGDFEEDKTFKNTPFGNEDNTFFSDIISNKKKFFILSIFMFLILLFGVRFSRKKFKKG